MNCVANDAETLTHQGIPVQLTRKMKGLLLASLALPAVAAPPAPASTDATRIGRTAVAKAPEFQELYDYDAAAKPLADATFPYEVQVHRAHVLMLAERGIVTPAEAATILRGLAQVDRLAAADPGLRSYLPYEAALIRGIGPVAGKLHTGRSRNDLANTVNRMFYRDQTIRILDALVALRRTVLDKAAAHADTIMIVYTHRKQAQPITLGHYLTAIAESLGKHITRYEQLYARLNQSPLGAAAAAGSGWPLDRERTARLLGFDGLVVNTIEATAGWDHIAEFAADNAIYLSTLGRLASEIQLWSTDEFDTAELDDAFAGISSIMPQKKNPDSLERTRQIAAAAMGPLTAILASLNSIEYQHSVSRVALEPRSIDALMAATHAMTGVVRTLQPHPERMLSLARNGFTTTTELADTLVRATGIPFRDAHEVVAHVVMQALAEKKRAADIDLPMVQAAARAHLGRELPLDAQAVRSALDPAENVRRRDGPGGPAPVAVARMIAAFRAETAAQEQRQEQRKRSLKAASAALADAEAAALAGQ